MPIYRVTIEKEQDSNFFNLEQLAEVKDIRPLGQNQAGHPVYQLEADTTLERELELIEGVLTYQIK
jgi:hypothetical protein